jgi:hypothetical protein
MVNIWRVTATWSGGKIGTGFTNMFFTGGISTPQLCADTVRTFFNTAYSTAGGALPTGISIAFPSGVDELDPANGELVTTLPVTQPASISGSDSGVYAAIAGACITWMTQGVITGKRVRGRTFLVPVGANYLQNDGSLSTLAVSNINTAANALIAAAPEFCIWRRPTSKLAGNGVSHAVLASRLQDKTAFLSSRR